MLKAKIERIAARVDVLCQPTVAARDLATLPLIKSELDALVELVGELEARTVDKSSFERKLPDGIRYDAEDDEFTVICPHCGLEHFYMGTEVACAQCGLKPLPTLAGTDWPFCARCGALLAPDDPGVVKGGMFICCRECSDCEED